MTEAEKLIRQAGGVRIRSKRHRVYLLDGYRFTLHLGGKPNVSEIFHVKKVLRKMGKIPI